MRVLLDFDGVLYHNPIIHGRIRHKTVQFLQMKTNLNYKDAFYLNNKEYPQKGHSALIIDDDKQTIHDYNEFVFTQTLFNDIYKERTIEDMKRIHELYKLNMNEHMDLVLCTNAPLSYCEHVLESSGFTLDMLFSTNHIYTSDSLHAVKPTNKYYSHHYLNSN